MNTAHQALIAEKISRESRKTEGMWNELVQQCRRPNLLGIVWLGMFAFFALLGTLFVLSRPDAFRPIYLGPVAVLAITSPLIFAKSRRKERALLAIISQKTPQLAQKLKAEGIV